MTAATRTAWTRSWARTWRRSSSASASGWGRASDPLLVSVRSGAVVSMPGMMDTILNLGMNDESVQGLAEAGGDERFAYDSYRRFVQMFGDVVAGVDGHLFENALGRMKMARGADADVDLSADDLRALVGEFLEIYRQETGEQFPQDPGRAAAAVDRRGVRARGTRRGRAPTVASTTSPTTWAPR